jgi:hypothetical protein
MNLQRKNIAAKGVLNKLHIRKEEFTARLRSASEGRDQAPYKRTMKLMTECRL